MSKPRSAGGRCAPALVVVVSLWACGEASPPVEPAADPSALESAPLHWGESKNGLRLSLSFAQTQLRPEQSVVATVRAQNTGTTPLELKSFEEETWCYQVYFEGQDGASDFHGGAGFFIEYEEPQNSRLAPGAVWQKTVDVCEEERRFLRVNPDRKPGDDWDYRDALPPGRYRAFVEYQNQGGAEAGFWTGRVKSNVVEIVVGS